MRLMLLFVLTALLMSGCVLTSNVDLAQARTQAETVDTELARVKALAAALDAQLVEARKLAEATGDANALKAVSVLSSAMATATQAIPRLEEASKTAKASLAVLEEQGDTAPLWKVLGSVGLLLLPKALSFVPGVGPFAEPVARGIGSLVWAWAGSKTQKQEDAVVEARSQALETQVKFANDLMRGVKVDDAKDRARAALEEAGIYEPVKRVVRAVEAAEPTSTVRAPG